MWSDFINDQKCFFLTYPLLLEQSGSVETTRDVLKHRNCRNLHGVNSADPDQIMVSSGADWI